MKTIFNLIRYATTIGACIVWIACIYMLILMFFPSYTISTFDVAESVIFVFGLYLGGWVMFGIGYFANEFYKNIKDGSKL
jgi:hypothetical protein